MKGYLKYVIDLAKGIDVSKKTLLTGKNAGGKSLIRKLLTSIIKSENPKAVIVQVSQELRTSSNPDLGAMSSFAHDLEWLATSANTIACLKQVIKKKDIATFLIIDEPEIGLGEELILGVCDWLNQELQDSSCGLLITTHSRLVVQNLNLCSEWINLDGLSKHEWLNRTPEKVDVKSFLEFSEAMRQQVQLSLKKS